MFKFTILQTADIHGALENLTRLATLADQIRADNPDIPVIHLDAGDAQDRENWLNNQTKGVAAYRLLSKMGCKASVMSNKSMKRYGVGVLAEYRATGIPMLVSNLYTHDGIQLPGTQPSMILEFENFKLGIVGVTAYEPDYVQHHNLYPVQFMDRIRQEIDKLSQQGANATIILSHMGIWDDDRIAHTFRQDIKLIIGGHSHSFFKNGKMRDNVAISHVGAFGHYLGKIDLAWDGQNLQVQHIEALPVRRDLPSQRSLITEIDTIKSELETS